MRRDAAVALCGALWLAAWPGTAASIGRQEAIARTAENIEQECQRDAGGDWQQWFEQMAAFREELNPIIAREWEKQRTGVVKRDLSGLLATLLYLWSASPADI